MLVKMSPILHFPFHSVLASTKSYKIKYLHCFNANLHVIPPKKTQTFDCSRLFCEIFSSMYEGWGAFTADIVDLSRKICILNAAVHNNSLLHIQKTQSYPLSTCHRAKEKMKAIHSTL